MYLDIFGWRRRLPPWTFPQWVGGIKHIWNYSYSRFEHFKRLIWDPCSGQGSEKETLSDKDKEFWLCDSCDLLELLCQSLDQQSRIHQRNKHNCQRSQKPQYFAEPMFEGPQEKESDKTIKMLSALQDDIKLMHRHYVRKRHISDRTSVSLPKCKIVVKLLGHIETQSCHCSDLHRGLFKGSWGEGNH